MKSYVPFAATAAVTSSSTQASCGTVVSLPRAAPVGAGRLLQETPDSLHAPATRYSDGPSSDGLFANSRRRALVTVPESPDTENRIRTCACGSPSVSIRVPAPKLLVGRSPWTCVSAAARNVEVVPACAVDARMAQAEAAAIELARSWSGERERRCVITARVTAAHSACLRRNNDYKQRDYLSATY